jgi:nucleotide-binding universal stress UspA family protein
MNRLRIRNILVPTDFSKMSIRVIEPANWLAERFAASIHLVHVREPAYPTGFIAPAPSFSVMTYEKQAKERVAGELKALAYKYGVPAARCHVLCGTAPFNEICGLAGKIPAHLIVMPTHGRTGLEHMFLGSTAERTVRHSPCPVFIIRQLGNGLFEKKAGYKKILVPVDFSDCSREGLRYAIKFAERFGAKLIVLHVISLPWPDITDVALTDDMQKDLARRMQRFLHTVEFRGVKVQTAITTGIPITEICSFAAKEEVDLIITSTHGVSGLKQVSSGSVAEKIVRHAFCPVVVVPSHPKIRVAKLSKRDKRKPSGHESTRTTLT